MWTEALGVDRERVSMEHGNKICQVAPAKGVHGKVDLASLVPEKQKESYYCNFKSLFSSHISQFTHIWQQGHLVN